MRSLFGFVLGALVLGALAFAGWKLINEATGTKDGRSIGDGNGKSLGKEHSDIANGLSQEELDLKHAQDRDKQRDTNRATSNTLSQLEGAFGL